MSKQVLSITQISEYLRSMMDNDPLLENVAVKGEISNYKVYPSGHHYFTLKDEGAALKCVMFKGNAMRLRFRPDNGAKVIAMGRITVYPRDGAYQLYCSAMALDGIGDLHAAFEQLKAKLSAQGLFDPAHKKPIPKYPGVIGIITSSAGAAVHDMLRILRRRYPLTKVRLLPVRVQGAEAPGEIASAIRYANAHKLADVLIVGRGGGSIEDLWAFNEEQVAYAIYDSRIPVISAVGHEPDVTISDYVADLRAATPSNAAELAVPDQDALRLNLDNMSLAMATALKRQLQNARRHLKVLAQSHCMQQPLHCLDAYKNRRDQLSERLVAAYIRQLASKQRSFVGLTAKLDAMSPLKVLQRGYSLTQDGQGSVVNSVKKLSAGESISVRFSDGRVTAAVTSVEEESYESQESNLRRKYS